ncbi:hypothetical protein E4T50_10328 [Aureobasidium sp. EXF-12298]|jgi:hypothetical protein|nr:hypothetical protein E4T50_10328 [Aureobasidium sp. EXF-12298]KAI4756981.1 hypothetical protein E4T51_09971 [Aureobasidium sp. EXF-12344]KAI4773942.1 hypothetical protein E4T52_11064 [Aureobasidium sp. EXF-3400]
MTSGPPVQLPPIAIGVLNNILSDDWSRVEVYFLSSSSLTTASVVSICDSMTESYVIDVLGEKQVEDYHEFLQPVQKPFSSVQDCIEHHFSCLDSWLVERSEPDACSRTYPHGIVVFNKNEQAALLIHVDQRNKIWHIGSIYLPVADLESRLPSLVAGDEWFGDICGEYDVRVPQNDPEIDENYKEHKEDETGAWKSNTPRFAVFSTGWSHALPVLGMLDDVHEDAPFGHADVELYTLHGSMYFGKKDKLREKFPAYVAADQRGERRHEGKGPCLSCRPLHKSIFIEVDNPEPRVKGVLVGMMEWDGETDGRSDEQLAEIGYKAKIQTKRVGVAFAVATAKAISADNVDQEPESWQEKS